MKILILRTIAHNRIWEGNEPICHYEGQSFEIIEKWEPNIIHNTLNDVQYGIGIYTEIYYKYKPPIGQTVAYTGTEEEHHPSLIRLNPITQNSQFFGEISYQSKINIAFSFVSKFHNIDKENMLILDRKLVEAKKEAARPHSLTTKYPSLCFTLEYEIVKRIFNESGFELPL